MSGLSASGALYADPAFRPPGPRRRPARARRRPWREDLRRGLGVSVLLHLLVLAAFLITWLPAREHDSSAPEPSFEIVYDSGSPDRPAAPVPEVPKAPQAPVIPPPASAEALPTPPPAPPPPPPEPRPQQTMPAAALPPPPPPVAEAPLALPLPPPPPPAPPRQETQQAAQPPRPPSQPTPQAQARPNPAPALPGVWMPGASTLASPPRQQSAPQPRLDTTLDTVAMVGRYALQPNLQVKGAQVGADWTAAFRRWLDENIRYPSSAVEAGHSGVNKVGLRVAADGTVLGLVLLKPSGSAFLDFGITSPFKGAKIPPLPPPVDAGGAEVELTVSWILIRR